MAVGVATSATPAAAATGNLQYGNANFAGPDATILNSSSSNRSLTVTNTGTGTVIGAIASAGAGVFASTGAGAALWGEVSTGTAVRANASAGTGIEVTGRRATLRLLPATGQVAPRGDTLAHQVGDVVADTSNVLWHCTASGTPGTWRRLSGPGTAGAFTVLAAPVRIYDSRPGTAPTVGTKAPLEPGASRVLSASANGSGVPAGASAVLLTILVVGAAPGDANLTVWADGVARPSANSMVWGGSDGRHSTLALSAVSPARNLRISSSVATDVAVDVVGFYD